MNHPLSMWESIAPIFPFVIITIVGIITKMYPPKKINPYYGYRTARSKSSQAAWDFAQKYAGHLMSAWGGAALFGMILQRMVMPENAGNLTTITALILALVVIAGVVIFTERELKKHFMV